MELGFAWGSYVSEDRYHLDFSVSYDFMKFFEQNMMRRTLDGYITQAVSAGSVYTSMSINSLDATRLAYLLVAE